MGQAPPSSFLFRLGLLLDSCPAPAPPKPGGPPPGSSCSGCRRTGHLRARLRAVSAQGQGCWDLAPAIRSWLSSALGALVSLFGKHAANRGSAFLGVAPGAAALTSGPTTSPGPCFNSGRSGDSSVEGAQPLSPVRGRRLGPLCGLGQNALAGPCPQGRTLPPRVTGSDRRPGTSAGTGVASSPHPRSEACRRLGGEDPQAPGL